MAPEFVQPKYRGSAFNCLWCKAYSQQTWICNLGGYLANAIGSTSFWVPDELNNYEVSLCVLCKETTFWQKRNEMRVVVYPVASSAPLPADDMPTKVKDIYQEAVAVLPISAKAAAALLRLALQYLCIELGEKGKNINDDIASLVGKGLPAQIQKSMDVLRVIGNNAVHPGQIDMDNDDKSIAVDLFLVLNLIVNNRITEPKKIQELYERLPQGALEAIEKRDSK